MYTVKKVGKSIFAVVNENGMVMTVTSPSGGSLTLTHTSREVLQSQADALNVFFNLVEEKEQA